MGIPLKGYAIDLEGLRAVVNTANFLKPAAMTGPDDAVQLLLAIWPETKPSQTMSARTAASDTTYLRLPLVFEETVLGIAWLWSRHLIEADLAVMSTFGQQIASALKRARLFQEVQSLAPPTR